MAPIKNIDLRQLLRCSSLICTERERQIQMSMENEEGDSFFYRNEASITLPSDESAVGSPYPSYSLSDFFASAGTDFVCMMSHGSEPHVLSKDSFASAIAYGSSRALHLLAQTSSEMFGWDALSRRVAEEERSALPYSYTVEELSKYIKSKETDITLMALEKTASAYLIVSSEWGVEAPAILAEAELPNFSTTDATTPSGSGVPPPTPIPSPLSRSGATTPFEERRKQSLQLNNNSLDQVPMQYRDRQSSVLSVALDAETLEPLEGCLRLLLLTRHAMVTSMRELAGVYSHLSFSLQYWIWSREHRVGFLFQQGFTSQIFQGISALWNDASFQQNSHIFSLRRLHRVVISIIGSLYFLLHNLNTAVGEVQHRLEEQTARPSHAERALELQESVALLHRHIRHCISGAKAVMDESMSHVVLAAGDYNREGDSLSSSSDVFSDVPQDSWAKNSSPKAHGAAGGTSFRHTTSSSSALLQMVRRTTELMAEVLRCGRAHEPPFVARYGRLLLATPALVASIIYFLVRYTPEDLFRMLKNSLNVTMQILHNYGVVPAKSIMESVLYSRPGVDDRLQAFEKEAEALAKIIRDYHGDYFVGMSEEELSQLQKSAFEALRRGNIDEEGFNRINQHYRDAVRHPLRGLFFGHLPRIVLIRMSVQSLEVTRVVNGIDEVLENNRLNFQVMTIVPLLAATCLALGWSWWKWKWIMRPVHHLMRQRWRDAHRILNGEITTMPHEQRHTVRRDGPRNHLNRSLMRNFGRSQGTTSRHEQEPRSRGERCASEKNPQTTLSVSPRAVPRARTLDMTDYEQGLLLITIHEMRMTVKWFLRNYSLYRELLNDLEMLENTSLPRYSRMEVLRRMRAIHRFL
eukprot:gene8428-5907_t